MGSCGNSVSFHEPFREDVVEQHSSSELPEQQFSSGPLCKSVETDAGPADGGLVFSRDESTGRVNSMPIDCTDRIKGDCQNVDGLSLKTLVDDLSLEVSGVCLNKIEDDFDLHNFENHQLCLESTVAQCNDDTSAVDDSFILSKDSNAACMSSDSIVTQMPVDFIYGMKDRCKNISGLREEDFVDDHGRVIGLDSNENWGEVDVCKSENSALVCLPRSYSHGDGCEDDHRNDKTLFVPSTEGAREEKVDDLVETDRDTCNQVLDSEGYEMLSELMPLTDSPRDFVEQNGQNGGESIIDSSLQQVMEAVEDRSEEKSDIPNSEEFGVSNQILSPQSCENHLELVNVTDEPTNCFQIDEQKHDKSTVCHFAERVTEEKIEVLVGIETKFYNQLSLVQGNDMPSESSAMTGYLCSNGQQNKLKDTKRDSDPALDGEGEAVFITEPDICSQISASQCAEGPLKSSPMGGLLSSCDWQNEQSTSDLSLESFTKTIETKGDMSIHLFPSKDCLKILDRLHVAEPLSNSTQESIQITDKIVHGPSADCVAENLEERSDLTTDIKCESCIELVPNCLHKKSASLSCQPFDVDTGLPGTLDPPDSFTKEASGATSSSSAVGCSEQTDNEGKVVVKADCVAENIGFANVSSSSRRGSRTSKSSRKTQAKRVTRNCRGTANVPCSRENSGFILKASRKKRSCSSKPARSSKWGLLGNISPFLTQCHELEPNEVQDEQLSKASDGQGRRKRSRNQSSKSRRASSRESLPSTSCIRLKVKMGKEVGLSISNSVVSETVDVGASVNASISNYGSEVCQEASLLQKSENGVEEKLGEKGTEWPVMFNKNLQKSNTCLDTSVTDLKLAEKDVGSTEIPVNSPGDVDVNNLEISSHLVVEATEGATEKLFVDPGTSPDSEVINSVPDVLDAVKHQEDFQNTILTTSGASDLPRDVKSSKSRTRGKKDGLKSSAVPHRRKSRNCSSRKNADDGSTETIASSTSAKTSKSQGVAKGRSKVSESARNRKGNASRQKGNRQKLSGKTKVEENDFVDSVVSRVESHPEIGKYKVDDNGNNNNGSNIASSEVANFKMVSNGVMEQPILPDSAWVRCDDCHKWRRIPVSLADEIDESCRWICKDNLDKQFADCSISQEKSNADINAELGISDAEEDGCDGLLNYKELEKGFELRRVSAQQASVFTRIDSNEFLHRSRKSQSIDEVMVCHCKPPPDGQLGCGDECLNRMLNIECVQGTCPCGDLCSNQQFQKRKYAKMKWQKCGKKGHGLKLLEDISGGQFLIEYVGEVLDMQAYEKRQKEYASRGQKHFYFMTLNGSEVIDACAKGNLGRFINHSCDPNCRTEKWMVNGEICIGLFALRDIKEGEEVTFDYNYVRVFGAAAKKCHCDSPHCRGYIGGDPHNTEIIIQDDSDDEYPEPVMLEDGETWDGFENMLSRSSSFDGLEMQTADSMLEEGDKKKSTLVVGPVETTRETEDSMNCSTFATFQLQNSVDTDNLKGSLQSPIEPVGVLGNVMEKKALNKSSCSIRKLETSLTGTISKLISDGDDSGRKSKIDTAEGKQAIPKSRPRMKISRSSGSVKKAKESSSSLHGNKVQMIANKSQVLSTKPKKSSEVSSTGRFEAVEEKLNDMLDAEGGISKRKDAAKGYLKLLLLTAASGNSGNGEAIQSNRDLSMILDALLKTRSRAVLTDIINKNGLRMLHNIMKQYRRDFKKIPILRKLLKVLEYLAVREILTHEHINGGPPCRGMESFRESILSLTEHVDKQVHQIARSFRDRWIPRHLRKLSYKDRDEGMMDFHWGLNCSKVTTPQSNWRDQGVKPIEGGDGVLRPVLATTLDTSAHDSCPSSSTGVSQNNGTKIRKRKSRWDQPADTELDAQPKEQKIESGSPKKLASSALPVLDESITDHVDKMSTGNKCLDTASNHYQPDQASINANNRRQSIHEDVPPGFSSPQNVSMVTTDASSTAIAYGQPSPYHAKGPSNVVMAHPQKYNSRLPVSYGFPLPVMQQFGSSQAERVDGWLIAPGMPFHPFPPLPPFPRAKQDTSPACDSNSFGNTKAPAEQQQGSCGPATCHDGNYPSTIGSNQPVKDTPSANIQQSLKRTRESYDLGKKYFRQQKRKGPPWLKHGCMGNNHMGGPCSIDVGNLKHEHKNSYFTHDVSCRVGKARNEFYQHPQHRNQH